MPSLRIRTWHRTQGRIFETQAPAIYPNGGGWRDVAEMRAELRRRHQGKGIAADIPNGLRLEYSVPSQPYAQEITLED